MFRTLLPLPLSRSSKTVGLAMGEVQFEVRGVHGLGEPETRADLLIQWLALSNVSRRDTDTDFGAGFSDPSVGIKRTLGSIGAWEVGLLMSVNIPVDGDLLGSGRSVPNSCSARRCPRAATSRSSHTTG